MSKTILPQSFDMFYSIFRIVATVFIGCLKQSFIQFYLVISMIVQQAGDNKQPFHQLDKAQKCMLLPNYQRLAVKTGNKPTSALQNICLLNSLPKVSNQQLIEQIGYDYKLKQQKELSEIIIQLLSLVRNQSCSLSIYLYQKKLASNLRFVIRNFSILSPTEKDNLLEFYKQYRQIISSINYLSLTSALKVQFDKLGRLLEINSLGRSYNRLKLGWILPSSTLLFIQYQKQKASLSFKYSDYQPQPTNLLQEQHKYSQFSDNFSEWSKLMLLTEQQIQNQTISNLWEVIRNIEARGRQNRFVGSSPCRLNVQANCKIYDQNVTKNKLVFRQSIQILQNKEGKQDVLRQICGLLNGGGGVILFGCKLNYFQLIAQGECLTQNHQLQIIKTIKSIVQNVSPKIGKQQIIINFVPIATMRTFDRQCQSMREEDYGLNFVKGCYVTRIIIRPDVSNEYFVSVDQKCLKVIRYKSLFSHSPQYLQTVELQNPRFMHHQKPTTKTTLNQQQQQWMNYLLNDQPLFDHESCLHPFEGFSIQSTTQFQSTHISLEKKYRFLSAIVAKPENIPKIQQKLTKNYNIQCLINPRFKKYSSIKGAVATALVYHSVPFNHLQQLLNFNEDFKFDNRYLMIVELTDHIKLVQRTNRTAISQQQLKNLQTWVDKQFREEHVRVQMVRHMKSSQQVEYYLRTNNKACNLFLYLILNSFGEKAMLKDPRRSIGQQSYGNAY